MTDDNAGKCMLDIIRRRAVGNVVVFLRNYLLLDTHRDSLWYAMFQNRRIYPLAVWKTDILQQQCGTFSRKYALDTPMRLEAGCNIACNRFDMVCDDCRNSLRYAIFQTGTFSNNALRSAGCLRNTRKYQQRVNQYSFILSASRCILKSQNNSEICYLRIV